ARCASESAGDVGQEVFGRGEAQRGVAHRARRADDTDRCGDAPAAGADLGAVLAVGETAGRGDRAAERLSRVAVGVAGVERRGVAWVHGSEADRGRGTTAERGELE